MASVSRPPLNEGLLAAVLRAPAVGLAAVRAVPIHPQSRPPRRANSGVISYKQARHTTAFPPPDQHLAVTRPAAQQHLHLSDRR